MCASPRRASDKLRLARGGRSLRERKVVCAVAAATSCSAGTLGEIGLAHLGFPVELARILAESVKIVGVYSVEAPEPCHLLEFIVHDAKHPVDLAQVTQPVPDTPRADWQAPWLEHILDSTGSSILADDSGFSSPRFWRGSTVRIAFFFHYLDLNAPINTWAGPVVLPSESPLPPRLRVLSYESP